MASPSPWAGLAYVSQTADGLTLRDPSLGEQRYSGLEVGEVEARSGSTGRSSWSGWARRTWLTLHGGVSYTQGLGGRRTTGVRVAALGRSARRRDAAAAQVWGLRLGGRLTVGGALALDAGLALEDDLATGAVGTGRVSFTPDLFDGDSGHRSARCRCAEPSLLLPNIRPDAAAARRRIGGGTRAGTGRSGLEGAENTDGAEKPQAAAISCTGMSP